jgi:hypothetical protein
VILLCVSYITSISFFVSLFFCPLYTLCVLSRFALSFSGVGAFRNPPVWLKHGDVVTVAIDGLGSVTNTCVDASAAKM